MVVNLDKTIYERLKANSTIKNAVKGNIVGEYRDDLTPALVFELRVDQVDQMYEGAGVFYYELIISVITDKRESGIVIADSVLSYLMDSEWSDSDNTVLGCFFQTRDQSYLATETKNKRVAIVELRFEMLVKGN